jgi:hypothetical protein
VGYASLPPAQKGSLQVLEMTMGGARTPVPMLKRGWIDCPIGECNKAICNGSRFVVMCSPAESECWLEGKGGLEWHLLLLW